MEEKPRTKKDTILKAIRQGLNKSQAAQSAGVSRYMLNKWLKEDATFASAFEEAELDACEPVEDKLREMALAGNIAAIFEWLRNRASDRWKDRKYKEVTNKNADLTEEQALELLKQRGFKE